MIVKNLRCLRDPNCERHPIHGGHLRDLEPVDPRVAYKNRQQRKRVGRQVWQTILRWEKYWKHPELTSSERQMLFVFMRDEFLLTERAHSH